MLAAHRWRQKCGKGLRTLNPAFPGQLQYCFDTVPVGHTAGAAGSRPLPDPGTSACTGALAGAAPAPKPFPGFPARSCSLGSRGSLSNAALGSTSGPSTDLHNHSKMLYTGVHLLIETMCMQRWDGRGKLRGTPRNWMEEKGTGWQVTAWNPRGEEKPSLGGDEDGSGLPRAQAVAALCVLRGAPHCRGWARVGVLVRAHQEGALHKALHLRLNKANNLAHDHPLLWVYLAPNPSLTCSFLGGHHLKSLTCLTMTQRPSYYCSAQDWLYKQTVW